MSHSLFRLTRAGIAAIGGGMDETQIQPGRTGRDAMSEDALDAQIGYNLKRASAFALNDFAVELTNAGLRPVTYGMLALIDERPGACSA
jgi:glycine/D-amino acid oxidase-like deaminating enzyme